MGKSPGKMPETTEMDKFVMGQDEFIEWILKNTNELLSEFRVYRSKNYILVGIDKMEVESNVM